MNLLRMKSLTAYLMGMALIASTLAAFTVSAQDNSAGRYRPEGRTFARNAANIFADRLFEARTYEPGTDLDEFAS